MATLVTPENLQTIEFDVTTSEGDSRVTIVSGQVSISMSASTSSAPVDQVGSFKLLLDPTLEPGKFRKASSMVSVAETQWYGAATPAAFFTEITEAQATLNDEENRVQLDVDLKIGCGGSQSWVRVYRLLFQVTTLAVV